MPITYTFDVFSSLNGYGAAGGWTGYWASRAQSCWTTARLVRGGSSGWSSGPTPIGQSPDAGL